jgi:hypothetical protein
MSASGFNALECDATALILQRVNEGNGSERPNSFAPSVAVLSKDLAGYCAGNIRSSIE